MLEYAVAQKVGEMRYRPEDHGSIPDGVSAVSLT
jgi:hypothetical protein